MPSLFDMDYGTVRKGTARLSGRDAPRATPSLWDYINAVSMTPVPGVSDAAAGLLAAKDFREGNYGSGALNAAGLIPFVPALGGIFKGVKGATTAEKKALLKAQQMAREGADKDTIWNATLWYKGKDGKWRTEIDDSGAVLDHPMPKVVELRKKANEATNIEDAKAIGEEYNTWMDMARQSPAMRSISVLAKSKDGGFIHPELTTAYQPGLPRIWWENIGSPKGGDYDEATNRIRIGLGSYADPTESKSVALHELQHAIQQREGMARGGSPEAMSLLDIAPPGLVDSIKRSHAYRLQVAQGRNANDALEGMLAPYMGSMGNAAEARMEAYKRLLGEVDARNTQKRMDMTLDQRREFPPWSTWDVPEEQQIVRFGDGPAMMATDNKLTRPNDSLKTKSKSNRWELVPDWKGADAPDDFYYHVTSQPNAERILQEGLLPGKKPIAGRGGVYAAHSKGKAFLTDAPGVNFWQERIENHLFDQFDNPPNVSIVRIPKSVVGDLPIDEIGTSDARAKAFIANKKLAGLLPYAIPAGLLGMFLTRPGEGYE